MAKLRMILYSAIGNDPTALQNAGSIAAIIGASVAVLLLLAGIVRWWWRHHGVRGLKGKLHLSGDELYLEIAGLSAAAESATTLVGDETTTKKCGPSAIRPDISPRSNSPSATSPT